MEWKYLRDCDKLDKEAKEDIEILDIVSASRAQIVENDQRVFGNSEAEEAARGERARVWDTGVHRRYLRTYRALLTPCRFLVAERDDILLDFQDWEEEEVATLKERSDLRTKAVQDRGRSQRMHKANMAALTDDLSACKEGLKKHLDAVYKLALDAADSSERDFDRFELFFQDVVSRMGIDDLLARNESKNGGIYSRDGALNSLRERIREANLGGESVRGAKRRAEKALLWEPI